MIIQLQGAVYVSEYGSRSNGISNFSPFMDTNIHSRVHKSPPIQTTLIYLIMVQTLLIFHFNIYPPSVIGAPD